MFYSFFYPLLFVLCLIHQNYLRILVIMRLRPTLLLKAKIRPATHYARACHLISLFDLYSLHVMSSWFSALYAIHLFEKTRALPYKQGELMLLSSCIQDELLWRGKTVTLFIYPQSSPDAEKILLLHGWDGRSIMFRQLAQQLQKQGYAVFAPDLPAHGISKGKKTSFYDLARFVLQIAKDYGNFSVVMGHSTGGLISCMAALQGMSFKSMVLMSSPSSYGKMVDRYVAINRLPVRIAASMKKIYRLRYGVHPDHIGPALYHEIKQPVLIVHDAQDVSLGMEHATELNDAFTNSQLVTTQGKGHNGALRDAEIFNHISDFVSRTINEDFYSFKKNIFAKNH
ncbi:MULTISPECIES: alpha/beta fold hydrolase [Dickeya]|uniref:alpha/beta fold hydrolase n=1 Tax=Dickeya TaxID=204037 RepID=UPI0005B34573|nr:MULTISPECIES: alpha/beta fold hydrolase [Dickeya]